MELSNSPRNYLVIGYFCALAATLIWSGNFIVARGLSESVPPVSLAFWRWIVAVLVFLPFALKPTLREWPFIRKNLTYLCVTAFLGVTVFNTLIYIAGHSTTAINLSLIAITFPMFVIIFARVFLGEALNLNKILGIILVVLGVLLLVSKGQLANLSELVLARGDLWMLIAAISFAAYSILVKSKPVELSGWTFQFSTFIIGLLFLLPFYLWEANRSDFSIWQVNIQALSAILYVGVMASLIAYIIWGKAIEILGPSQCSLVYYTLPVFSGLAAYLFLDEQIGMIHLGSMLLILMGVLLALKRAS